MANKGRVWEPKGQPVRVDVHDFPNGKEKAIPYGVLDLGANEGFVVVGDDADTAQFAVSSIGRWWDEVGSVAYPEATRLLVTADAGGSSGCRSRLWKLELSELAARSGLEITVCHFPPGTSKWNKDRAPALRRVLHELMGEAAHQPRGRREPDRSDDHPSRPQRESPSRQRLLPEGDQGRQRQQGARRHPDRS